MCVCDNVCEHACKSIRSYHTLIPSPHTHTHTHTPTHTHTHTHTHTPTHTHTHPHTHTHTPAHPHTDIHTHTHTHTYTELPFSFCGMIHGVAAAKDYPTAIRNSILAGGDSGSRSSFIGACLAAKSGLSSIPLEWILKLKRAEEILGYIEAVVQC